MIPTLHLIRVKVSLLATFTAVTGFILSPAGTTPSLAVLMLAVFFLSAGASALNQVQEWPFDARMTRTSRRPIPAGEMSPSTALRVAIGLIAVGAILLGITFSLLTTVLGLMAIVWYNAVYTPMKRCSAFAAVPGALVGALPPAMGWVAGGGHLLAPPNIALMVIFFLWQVPHFWLLMLAHQDDYIAAGFPVPTRHLPTRTFTGIVFLWTITAITATVLLPVFGLLRYPVLYGILLVLAIWLGVNALALLKRIDGDLSRLKGVFAKINIYALTTLILLIFDHTLTR